MVTKSEITAAYDRIAEYIRRTPVLELESGALFDGAQCWLKLEQFQHTGSFKVRGAFNALLRADQAPGGVVAYSGGNHGAAVAYAARSLGLKSTIFVPDFAGAVKVERMQNFGAEVRLMSDPAAEIVDAFQNFANTHSALAVHPYDDVAVITGQATLGLEIEDQLPEFDTIVVSVGGGGLAGGIGAWFGDKVNIIAVETEGTATLATALKQGLEATILPTGLAASALGAGSIGELPFDILAKTRVKSIIVTDQAVKDAQSRLWDRARILGEPGAATALAALTSGGYVPEHDERVCIVVCGANTAPDWFIDQP